MARQYKTKYKVKWVRKLNKCRTVKRFLDLRDEFYIENQCRFLSANISGVKSGISTFLRRRIKLYNLNMEN